MDLRFFSRNPDKIAEVQAILAHTDLNVIPVAFDIRELQTTDVEQLVSHKLLQAFGHTGRPAFVEHTGLYLDGLDGFPGGLTQIFWEKTGPEKFVAMVNGLSTRSLVARTTVGYCDGRRTHFFNGELRGEVPAVPAGPRHFQWDCVFVPEGHSQTLAELEPQEKNTISMRCLALQAFVKFLGR